jgi:hypothetical protein
MATMKKYAMGGMTTTSETTKKPVSSKRVEFKKTPRDREIEKSNKGNASGVRAKSGTTMKKAKSGLGMKSVKSGYDNNSGVTRADFVAIGKGTAKSGTKMKMGGKMAKQAAVAIAMKKAGKTPKKMQYGGEAASMAPMKAGGKMKKCKYGCK